jgi:N-carbamoylputrescine amidase
MKDSTDATTLTVGLVQMSCTEEPEVNVERAVRGVREAAGRGARVICLQELFSMQYPGQTEDAERFDLAEPVPGPTTEKLSPLAAELDCVLVVPLFERRAPGVFHNTTAVIDADGKLLGVYRKMHIPDDPLYYEKYYFAPGDTGFRSFRTRHGCIGVLVCWDQWFPEAARLTALTGAQVIFYPTAIGYTTPDPVIAYTTQRKKPEPEFEMSDRHYFDAWQTVQRGHAVANGCYVAVLNRVGYEKSANANAPKDEGIKFWGRSFVAGPLGEMLAEAGDGEEVLVAECNLEYLEQVRRLWPLLRDRRVDAYGPLTKRWIGS